MLDLKEVALVYKGDLIEDLREGVSDALNKDISENPFLELAEKLRF